MAGRRVETQPTVPPTEATGLPPGVAAERVVWDETIPERGYATARLARGVMVRITDLSGDACVSLVVHDAVAPTERLNVADTVKVQWNAYLGEGTLLLSDMGRALMSIRADTAAGHDTVCGPSRAGADGRLGARERLLSGLAKHGLGRRDLPPAISLFALARVAADGTVVLAEEPGPAGAHVDLRAETDVLLTLANAPHPLDTRPGPPCTPARVTAWIADGPPPEPEWSLEARRALDNTRTAIAGREGIPFGALA